MTHRDADTLKTFRRCTKKGKGLLCPKVSLGAMLKNCLSPLCHTDVDITS